MPDRFAVVLSVLLLAPMPALAQPRPQDAAVNAVYALTPRSQPGDLSYYRITKTDETIDAGGRIASRVKSAGLFSRETLYIAGDGGQTDRFTWKAFSTGRSESASDSVAQASVAAIQGFTYDLPSSDGMSAPSIAIGGLAKTPDTFTFFTVAWDAATLFQSAAARTAYPVHTLKRIGDHITETSPREPAQFDFTPVVSRFSYVRNPMTTAFTGLSAVDGAACLLLRFESEANPVSYVYSTDRLTIDVRGAEWISGSVSLTVDTMALLHGEMSTTLIATQTGTMPGKTVEMPVVVRQKVHLERIPAEVFR